MGVKHGSVPRLGVASPRRASYALRYDRPSLSVRERCPSISPSSLHTTRRARSATRRDVRVHARRLRRPRDRRRLHRCTAARARQAGARCRPAAVQPGDRRGRADGLPVGARRRLRHRGAGRRRRPARRARHPAACATRCSRRSAARTWSPVAFPCRDGDGYRSSASRRAGIRLFGRVLSLITGRRITDPTSGFRMCDRKGIALFARDYPHDYPEVEAILMMHAHGLQGEELPVLMRERTSGRSSISPGPLGLLHDQGAARDPGRPVARAADESIGRQSAGLGAGLDLRHGPESSLLASSPRQACSRSSSSSSGAGG